MAHSDNKTDTLFRLKLEQLEVAPKATSWEAVKGQIQQEKGVYFPVWRVAASIVVLLTIGLVVYKLAQEPASRLVSSNDHPTSQPQPTPIEVPQKSVETNAFEKKTETKAPLKHTNTTKPEVKEQPKPAASSVPRKSDAELSQFNFITLDRKVEKPLDILLPVELSGKILPEKEVENYPVKITYIASDIKVTETDLAFTSKLTKVINKAQQLSPGELLADIRDAKDQLLSRN